MQKRLSFYAKEIKDIVITIFAYDIRPTEYLYTFK